MPWLLGYCFWLECMWKWKRGLRIAYDNGFHILMLICLIQFSFHCLTVVTMSIDPICDTSAW